LGNDTPASRGEISRAGKDTIMRLLAIHPNHAGCTAAIALIASLGMTAAAAAASPDCYWKGPAHALAAQGGHDCTDTLVVDINGKPYTYVGVFGIDCTDILIEQVPGKPFTFVGVIQPTIDDTLIEAPGKPHTFVGVIQHDCIDTLIEVYVKPHTYDIADHPSATEYFITPLPVKPLRLLPMDGPSCTEGLPDPEACTWKGHPDCYAGNFQHPWTDGSSPADEKLRPHGWRFVDPGPSATDGSSPADEKLDPHGWRFVDPGPPATDGSTPAPVIKASYELNEAHSITNDPCHADINDDGRVDEGDLHAIFDLWGEGSCPADCNGDGIVDARDVMAVLASWGYCP
jgi:hypothetical protein